MKCKYPELLLPAGGSKQLTAAVENGADAVYVGGRLFNARINATNFDKEELSLAIDYAHKRGVKIYVTMNTLVRDDEMEDAVRYACELYEIGADAIIIQDLGLGAAIKSVIPDMPLHLSTQACCYDSEAVKLAYELGYERVVLARELNIEEIRDACENTDAEIEVFVHGALCISYSGECQLSRYYGGRSGNRGSCAQPCRLPWHRADRPDDKAYQLSPKDVCLIDYLGELIEAGVASFKIEGRMKSPEYVALVASIYRKYIDEYIEKGSYTVDFKDRQALMQIFNRGGFTEGYINGNPGDSLMSGSIPKNQGLKVGTVTGTRKGSTLVDIKLSDNFDLTIGDGVEIYGKKEKAGNIISYCKDIGPRCKRIGDIRHNNINAGATVYRTSSIKQLEAIRRSYEGARIDDGEGRKCNRKLNVDIVLEEINNCLCLSAEAGGRKVKISAGPFEADAERKASRERYTSALSKSGGTPFEIRDPDVPEKPTLNVKVSDINALRREALSKLEQEFVTKRKAVELAGKLRYPENVKLSPIISDKPRIALAELCRMSEEEIKNVCPENVELYISTVSRGKEDEILLSNFDKCVEYCGKFGVSVGNLGWLNRLRGKGLRLTADSGLNCFNAYAADLFESLGAEKVVSSAEAADMKAFEVGRLPLIISEHDWSNGSDKDVVLKTTDNKKIIIKRKGFSSQSYIMLK